MDTNVLMLMHELLYLEENAGKLWKYYYIMAREKCQGKVSSIIFCIVTTVTLTSKLIQLTTNY